MSGFVEKRRVVVQIAVTPETEGEYAVIYALADDGTLWLRVLSGDGSRWRRMSDIPQGDED